MREDRAQGAAGEGGSVASSVANGSAAAPLALDSLVRRMRAMHSLYYQAVGSMGIEHVNHFERDGVLPIAFSLFHSANLEDASFMLITGVPPVWDAAWQRRVAMAVDDHGKHLTVAEMVHQRIGDYEAFCEYQRVVFDRTEAHLEGLDSAELARVVIGRPFPPQIESTFSARVAGPPALPCSMRSNAGCTSTGCGTWERSSWPGPWSGSAA